jgi:hypothetical protein
MVTWNVPQIVLLLLLLPLSISEHHQKSLRNDAPLLLEPHEYRAFLRPAKRSESRGTQWSF